MSRCFLGAILCAQLLWPKSPVKATDLFRIRQVTSVDVARDGSKAVFSVKSVEAEAYRSHLYLIELENEKAKPVALTSGDRNDQTPQLSPDGSLLAFVRRDSATGGKPQVWVMPAGAAGEARMVTHLEEGAAEFVWHPGGKSLLVSSNILISKIEGKPHFDLERPGRSWKDADPKAGGDPDGKLAGVRDWLEKNAAGDNPHVITRLQFQDEEGLRREMTVTHLFTVDAESGKATQLTKGFEPHQQFQYSPDGSRILFLTLPPGTTHPDRHGAIIAVRHAVAEMHADGSGRTIHLDRNESYSAPRYFPDGNSILVGARKLDEPSFRQARLLKLNTGDGRVQEGNWPGSVTGAQPAAGGAAFFTGPWHGGEPLLRDDFSGTPASPLLEGPSGVGVFAEGGGRIVYSLVSVPNPNELYVRERGGRTRRLTGLNASWLEDRTLSLPEEHWLTRPDGTRVQFWIMKPAGFERGRKTPWVLDMHGGPAAMWGPGEATMWHEFQLLTSWGYGVVYANPRGSGGYGHEFQKANFRNWGEGPGGDVLVALEEARRLYPEIDGDRLFLTGGSYAGYLTAWIVAHDHRFRAAAAQRGVYDLRTFFGEGNAWRLAINAMGGEPWDPDAKAIYERESPITWAHQIRTPLLILHGSNDQRTGVSQSEMLYRTLKHLGRPVEYVRYPGVGHELTRSGPPRQRLDHLLRIIEFFERYR